MTQQQQPAARVQLISTWCRHLLTLVIASVLIIPVVSWLIFPELLQLDDNSLVVSVLKGAPITPHKQILGFAITLLPALTLVYTLIKLRRVFGEYAKGRVFSLAAVQSLRAVGIGGCALVFAQFLVTPLMSLAMSYDAPAGEKQVQISIGASSGGLLAFFAAIMFLVLAWGMSEARKNAEDLAMIV